MRRQIAQQVQQVYHYFLLSKVIGGAVGGTIGAGLALNSSIKPPIVPIKIPLQLVNGFAEGALLGGFYYLTIPYALYQTRAILTALT